MHFINKKQHISVFSLPRFLTSKHFIIIYEVLLLKKDILRIMPFTIGMKEITTQRESNLFLLSCLITT